ncbi:hypothetical protein TRIUR3_27408 [Triticum urartu]|uniref:Uncharacterized protein n=1 Tax=Triticum urartu TaxID=4572 RepID=M7YPV7_TRIUA|nr:hypothetical protein TRIUR3_27408 [Triticum urartu]
MLPLARALFEGLESAYWCRVVDDRPLIPASRWYRGDVPMYGAPQHRTFPRRWNGGEIRIPGQAGMAASVQHVSCEASRLPAGQTVATGSGDAADSGDNSGRRSSLQACIALAVGGSGASDRSDSPQLAMQISPVSNPAPRHALGKGGRNLCGFR